MTRKKNNCEECGRQVANSKLIMIPGSNKRLCNICRVREEKEIKKTKLMYYKPVINNFMNNSMEKQISFTRLANFRKNNLSREEEQVLKNKYSFDKMVSGSKMCEEVINLKQQLNKTRNKIHSDKIEEVKKIEESKQVNKRFLEGLIQHGSK